MVMKNLDKFKQDLPGLLDFIIFYDTGMVFQSTCPEKTNVPIICANFNEVIKILKQSLSCYEVSSNEFQKIIFETKKYIIIILKLGTDSNIALFFKNEAEDEAYIHNIQKCLDKLEELIDMDRSHIGSS